MTFSLLKLFVIPDIVSSVGFCLFVYCCSVELTYFLGQCLLQRDQYLISPFVDLAFIPFANLTKIACKSFPPGLVFSFSSFVSRVFYWLSFSKEQFLQPGQRASSKGTYLNASKNSKEENKIPKLETDVLNTERSKGNESWWYLRN